MAKPKVTWIDTVHLTNTEKGWRVDNVIFDKINSSKDLKTGLQSFIKYAKEQNK